MFEDPSEAQRHAVAEKNLRHGACLSSSLSRYGAGRGHQPLLILDGSRVFKDCEVGIFSRLKSHNSSLVSIRQPFSKYNSGVKL